MPQEKGPVVNSAYLTRCNTSTVNVTQFLKVSQNSLNLPNHVCNFISFIYSGCQSRKYKHTLIEIGGVMGAV